MRNARLSLLALLPFGGCICGEPLIVEDVFAPSNDGTTPGTLHTYASSAVITLEVRSVAPFLDINDVTVAVAGELALDAEDGPEVKGDVLEVPLRTANAGTGTIAFGRGDELLTERTLEIVDVDDIALSVTSADQPGIALPVVDVDGVRIFAGGKAAFRATLLNGGDEVFGLEALTITASDASATTRNAIGCAAESCELPRNAAEIGVPAAVAAPFDVTLTAGTASLVVTVVPTTIDDVTELGADIRDTADLEELDLTGVVALPLAGDEPVFGAPVEWELDGTAFVDAESGDPITGDALQVAFSALDTLPVAATLGEHTFSVVVDSNGEDASVTSITTACGAASAPPLLALLALLARRPRRA